VIEWVEFYASVDFDPVKGGERSGIGLIRLRGDHFDRIIGTFIRKRMGVANHFKGVRVGHFGSKVDIRAGARTRVN